MQLRFEIARILPVFMGAMTLFAAGCGGPVESSDVAADDTGTTTAALGGPCQINPNGTAVCEATAIATVSGRNVYYRVGATAGPGFDASTGRHSAVVLFQGTGFTACFSQDNGGGGNNGPGTTTTTTYPTTAAFGVWHQLATVVALVNAGYTVIQPAARKRPLLCTESGGPYAWDTNFPGWNNSPDRTLMNGIVAGLQPSSVTFGSIDINHVYAAGISSGGYMSSRIANEFAGGLNANGTVRMTNKPFRAVAIQSGSFQTCAGTNCTVPNPLTNTAHPPTFFLHDVLDGVVPFDTMTLYYNQLNGQFQGGNPAYTVNGVQEEFLRQHMFDGMLGHHQWSQKLDETSTNLILDWFNDHR